MGSAERKPGSNERPDVAIARLAAQQFGVVSTEQLRATGLSQAAITRRGSAGRLEKALPRIYRLAGYPETWEQKVMATTLWAGGEASASHATAASLWGFDGMAPRTLVTVSSPAPMRRPHRSVEVKKVRVLHNRDRTRRWSIPVTTPSRTLLDLGTVVDHEVLEAALESALRLGLTSLPRLRWQLEVSGGRGVRGTAALRKLVDERGAGYVPTHSVLEARFRRLLKRHRFPQPEQQHVVWRNSGQRAFVDFCYPELGLVIEVDGFASHGSRISWNEDLRRQNDLVITGLRVLRFTWTDLTDGEDAVVSQLRPKTKTVGGNLGGGAD
jgi:very-short-patch-repair endonuclease